MLLVIFSIFVVCIIGPGNRFPTATKVVLVVLLLGVVVIRFAIY